jgi:hypothetical protein
MEKPEKYTREYYDYGEVIDYIEDKYNIKTRGYTPQAGFTEELVKKSWGTQQPYLDFWHWILDHNEISNGCMLYLECNWMIENETENYCPYWVKEILRLIRDEFGNEITCWIEW